MNSVEEIMMELTNEYGSNGCIEIIHYIRSIAYQELGVKHSTLKEYRDWELITDAMDAAVNVLKGIK